MTRLAIPMVLVAALLFGGSAQGALAMLTVELLAAGLIVWAFVTGRPPRAQPAARYLEWGAWACAGLLAFQLVPLPPGLWQAFPGRDWIAVGDAMIGSGSAWRPISLDPQATVAVLAFLGVPLAIIIASRRLPLPRVTTAAAIVAVALFGALWGLAQHAGAAAHPYAFSSTGPTGQFANTNHLAALCLAAVPFLASLAVKSGRKSSLQALRVLLLVAAFLLSLVVVLTGAMAVIALMLPVLLGAFLIAGRRTVERRSIVLLAGVMALVGLAGVWLGSGSVSATSRGAIWTQSMALLPYAWTGSGFGTFERLYQTAIDPMTVDHFIVNHAHNDLIELVIEGGLPALLLLALLLWWLGKASLAAWNAQGARDPFAQAASIAAAILLLHSLVDFPMRTLALAALFATCLALLARQKPLRPVAEVGELRPTRHRRVR